MNYKDMKTAAFFVNPHANDEVLIRVQSRLISLFTMGHWEVIVPARPYPAEWQIVETCVRMGRKVTTIGMHKPGLCTAKHYQQIKIPFCNSRKFLNSYSDYADWERDNWIIAKADMVICYDSWDIYERVPRNKGLYLLPPLIEPPGFGDPDFYKAQEHGLGKLLIEGLRAKYAIPSSIPHFPHDPLFMTRY